MPDMLVSTTRTVNGFTSQTSATVSAESSSVCDGVTLAAAKTGTLSTRTNDAAGTITGASGHGVTTGAVIDVYWETGQRVGVTVGTVSGTTIPISSGSGDNLPIADTALTLMVPVSESFIVPANSAQSLAVQIPGGKGVVRFRDGSNAVVATYKSYTGSIYNAGWDAVTGGANPFDTDAVATILMSNGSTTAQIPKIHVTFTA
jgi:hypothetical protein